MASYFSISTCGQVSARLTVNYRITRENLGYSLQIHDGEQQWQDGPDAVRIGPLTHTILLGMGEDVLPAAYQLAGLGDAERADALQRERALLYVAATRARDGLVITTHGKPSKLLPAG